MNSSSSTPFTSKLSDDAMWIYSQLNGSAKKIRQQNLKKSCEDLRGESQTARQTAMNTIAMLGTAVLGGALLFEASLTLIGASAVTAVAIGFFAWKYFSQKAQQADDEVLRKSQELADYATLNSYAEIVINPNIKEYRVGANQGIRLSYDNGKRLVFTYDNWTTQAEVTTEERNPLYFFSKILKAGERLEFAIQTKTGDYLRGYKDDFVVYAN